MFTGISIKKKQKNKKREKERENERKKERKKREENCITPALSSINQQP